ncbi:hypothetical protein [Bradyrhizobium glycinis]|uniref:hypothetical protein n=1 Tax=Bradyrhizobium glycinis TaxID=2751812 RepID=UPI0018D6C975|nr:hypothetical protein [Bradyrhizobium glycinis]MBH5371098.1 hypothetical protein [Bradyrhizobium glycinis]
MFKREVTPSKSKPYAVARSETETDSASTRRSFCFATRVFDDIDLTTREWHEMRDRMSGQPMVASIL